MGRIENLAKKAASSEKVGFIDDVRVGWNNYSFIFYIGGISAILGGVFGVAGWLSTILTVGFFYYTGKFKKQVDKEKAKREKLKEKNVRLKEDDIRFSRKKRS